MGKRGLEKSDGIPEISFFRRNTRRVDNSEKPVRSIRIRRNVELTKERLMNESRVNKGDREINVVLPGMNETVRSTNMRHKGVRGKRMRD